MAQLITIKGTPVTAANEVLVADSNSKIPAVDGSAVTAMAGGNITGTIPTARLDTGTTANKLVVIGATGLPAVDGSLLTGIVSHTTSASDPAIDTNPSTGVGTEWINSTSGKQFICTNATAGANVWKCSGSGSDSIQPFGYQGSTAGFIVGGYSGATARLKTIDEISFTSDGAATDAGDLATGNPGRSSSANTSSETHLFSSGGYGPGAFTANTADVIESFSFASKGTMVDVGNLVHHIRSMAGTGNADYGFVHGGHRAANDPSGAAATYNVIWRYAHVSSGNASDVGDLQAVADNCGANSDPANSYGYCASGSGTNMIQRYAMSSSGNSVDWADLTTTCHGPASSSTTTHGYRSGDNYSAPHTKTIEKYPFATQTNATDIGDLIQPYNQASGVSSTTHGYSAGGYWNGSSPAGAGVTNIDKYSFTTDGSSADVGDLTANRTTLSSVGGQV